LEVRRILASLVLEPKSSARRSSPDFVASAEPRRRVARLRRRVTTAVTAPASFASSSALLRCNPHAKPCTGTLDWVSPASSAAGHRRLPPPAANRPLTRNLGRRIEIRSACLNPPPRFARV
jgi:hypothetical protein